MKSCDVILFDMIRRLWLAIFPGTKNQAPDDAGRDVAGPSDAVRHSDAVGRDNAVDSGKAVGSGKPATGRGGAATSAAGRGSDLPADATMSFSVLTLPEVSEREGENETDASGPDQAAIEALPRESALLVVQRGPNARARYLLDGERTTAGRHPKSDIFLDDATVSRTHAEFLQRDGRFFVRDTGALNGTYVNRDRIDEIALNDGDEVQIGKYRLVFYPSRQAI
jgi:hypothetical protein